MLFTLIVVQNDPWLVRRCENALIVLMENFYKCRFSANLARLNLVAGNIILKDVYVEDLDSSRSRWSWSAKKIEISWSWKDLIRIKRCDIVFFVDALFLKSNFSRCAGNYAISNEKNSIEFAIMPHIMLLSAPASIDIPCTISSCFVRDGHILLYEQLDPTHDGAERGYQFTSSISCELSNFANVVRASVIIDSGVLRYGVGIFSENIYIKNTWKNSHYAIDAHLHMPLLPEEMRTIKVCGQGDIVQGSGTYDLTNESDSFSVIAHMNNENNVIGDILFLVCGGKNRGVWQYDRKTGELSFSWTDITAPEVIKKNVHTVTGKLIDDDLILQAFGDGHQGELVCSFSSGIASKNASPIFFKKIMYTRDSSPLIFCTGNEQGFSGILTNDILHILARLWGFNFQGEGAFVYNGFLINSLLMLNLKMHDAHIRIPQTYSVIQKIEAEIIADMYQRSVLIKNAQIDLYKGAISCSQATIMFDENGAFSYFHFPVLMNKCFFGWKKDLFAQISGALMMSMYEGKEGQIKGAFTVDQAHIRGNVLSSEFQQDFFGTVLKSFSAHRISSKADYECSCDISYATRSPLEIKTPFLEGAVVCEGHFGGSVSDPYITGTVSFVRGTLAFPYKPLFITKGVVTVQPESLDDPLIDLIARGHVKKYDIELMVTGSIRNPHIVFSSSPFLEQANIITLLLGGLEDGSLYFLMPKVISNTLESLLFGPAHSTSRVQKYLKNLVRPFKGVTIMPRLSDQEGRGGVRGALSFEVNDRLRAVISKNVSLPEDSTFEIEYDISDDTSFRAMRDERGDLGLEGEMRWKF